MVTNDHFQAAPVVLRTVESDWVSGPSCGSNPDAELEAMETISSALASLDDEARQCVLAWAGAKFIHADAFPSENPSAWIVR
jgi:hypothetical protein